MQIHWWQSPHDQWAQLLRQCKATSGGAARARCARGTTQTTPGSLHCNSYNYRGSEGCNATAPWEALRSGVVLSTAADNTAGHFRVLRCFPLPLESMEWDAGLELEIAALAKLRPLLPGFSHSGARGVSPSVPGPFPPWGLHITIIPICNATWEGTLLQSCFFICKEAPHQCYPGCIIQECILPVTEER